MKILKYMQMATIVATLGFVSCNNDDIPQIDNGELKIIATIGDDKTRVNTEEDGSKFLPGDSLMIHYGSSSDNTYYVTKNGTVNGIAEFQPTNKKITFDSPNAVFGAIYTYKYICDAQLNYGNYLAMINHKGGVTDQSTVEKLRKFDTMLGIYNANYFETSVVSFNMKHIFSKVTVTIKEYNGFENPGKDSYKINNMTIYNKFSDLVLQFDGNEYIWFPQDWNTKISEILPLMKEDKTNGKHSFTAIIAPNKYATGDVFLSFEFQGVEYKVLANSDLCRDGFLESGKHYHFDLTINKKASVKMSNVTLIDWEEEEFTEFTR